MKKNSIYIFVVCCFVFLNIQTINSQIRLGIKGGVDVINHKINSDLLSIKNQLGYQLGATLEVLPFNGFGVETGLLYGRQKFDVNADNSSEVEITDYNYLSIPLNLKYRFSITQFFGIYAIGGVYGAVKLKGGDLHVAYEDFKAKQFEGGINAGFGVSLFSNFDIGLGIRYKLTDRFDVEKPSFNDIVDLSKSRPKYWSVNAAFYF